MSRAMNLLCIGIAVAVVAFYDPFPASAGEASSSRPPSKRPKAAPRVALPPGQDPKGSLTAPKARRGAAAPRAARKPLPTVPGSLTTPTKQSASRVRPKRKTNVPRGASLTAPSKPGS